MINIKSDDDIKRMRESGHITATVLRELSGMICEGIFVKDLDRHAEDMIKKMGAIPAFKNYRGYPATLNVSINEQVVHGIPGKRRIKDGDVVSIDMGVFLNGWCSDSALTVIAGTPNPKDELLLKVTKESLFKGIEKCCVGLRLGDISNAVQTHVESNGFSVVRDLVGHGIGKALHEDPSVPNYGKAGMGPTLKKGFVVAVEPMVNTGGWQVACLDDGWTVVTQDGLNSAHFEHTIAITERGPRILTLPLSASESEEYPFSG